MARARGRGGIEGDGGRERRRAGESPGAPSADSPAMRTEPTPPFHRWRLDDSPNGMSLVDEHDNAIEMPAHVAEEIARQEGQRRAGAEVVSSPGYPLYEMVEARFTGVDMGARPAPAAAPSAPAAERRRPAGPAAGPPATPVAGPDPARDEIQRLREQNVIDQAINRFYRSYNWKSDRSSNLPRAVLEAFRNVPPELRDRLKRELANTRNAENKRGPLPVQIDHILEGRTETAVSMERAGEVRLPTVEERREAYDKAEEEYRKLGLPPSRFLERLKRTV